MAGKGGKIRPNGSVGYRWPERSWIWIWGLFDFHALWNGLFDLFLDVLDYGWFVFKGHGAGWGVGGFVVLAIGGFEGVVKGDLGNAVWGLLGDGVDGFL